MSAWPDQHAVEVGDGVVALLQGRGEAGVSNAGLVLEGGGALVVDTMMFPEMAQGLVDQLAQRRASAEVVLNTHHHVDHIGGNTLFPDARIVAHPRTVDTVLASGHPVAIYDGFMTAFRGRFADLDVRAPEPVDAALHLPQDAQLRSYVPAHTPGDTAVWLADERILFTGDLCFFGVAPLALQGLLSSWVGALDDLIALAPSVVVPGHGPIGGIDEMVVVRDHLSSLLVHGRDAVAAGATLDDALATFDAGPVADWIESERAVVNLERAMQEARGEIGEHHLDVIPPSFGRLLDLDGC